MRLPFLDREEERRRLKRFLEKPQGGLAVLYGRRRCGKSRLLLEALRGRPAVYYIGDGRGSELQRRGLAVEAARLIPGFDAVRYPDWDALFDRFWREAPAGAVLAIDEFPALVSSSPEIPSLLQKRVDHARPGSPKLVLTGSSQGMMEGIVLSPAAPLYGRAEELLEIRPLAAHWIQRALSINEASAAIEAFSVWGGVPRYWELAAECVPLEKAVSELVLSPLGVLHAEPEALLLDDLRDTVQAASILNLIGQGCHRLSEIAGRLGRPATSLSRPLQRLIHLGLVHREVPFGVPERDSKRNLYRISDPFLRFWFRFVAPNRSQLEAGQLRGVLAEIRQTLGHHVGGVWEDLVRQSVLRRACGRTWTKVGRWWGPGSDGKPLEIDVVATDANGNSLLLGEAKWNPRPDGARLARDLIEKSNRFPGRGDRRVQLAVWTRAGRLPAVRGVRFFGAEEVLRALR